MALDPTRASSFSWKTHRVSTGYTYRYIDQVPKGKDAKACRTVVCLHGFPDLAFGWRYQVLEFVKRGFRVIVPDQLGYGGTDKPEDDLAAYSFIAACRAVHEILAAAGVKDKPVICAHDWGAMIAWRYLLLYPNEVAAMMCACVPPTRPSQKGDQYLDTVTLVRNFAPSFGYQIYFGTDEAVKDLDNNICAFLEPSFSPRKQIKSAKRRARAETWEEKVGDWALEGKMREKMQMAAGSRERPTEEFDEPELRTYIEEFRLGGMRGPLSWYRTREINHEEEIKHGLPKTYPRNVPVLFLPATSDGALPLSLTNEGRLARLFPGGNLEVRVVDGDHWFLQDPTTRDGVNRMVGDWIEAKVARAKM